MANGFKTGGRKRGSLNKSTRFFQELSAKALETIQAGGPDGKGDALPGEILLKWAQWLTLKENG